MINKTVENVQKALMGVESGMTLLFWGALGCVEFLKMPLPNWSP